MYDICAFLSTERTRTRERFLHWADLPVLSRVAEISPAYWTSVQIWPTAKESPNNPFSLHHQTCLPHYHVPRSACCPNQQPILPHNALLKSDGISPPLLLHGARSETPTSSAPPVLPPAKYSSFSRDLLRILAEIHSSSMAPSSQFPLLNSAQQPLPPP